MVLSECFVVLIMTNGKENLILWSNKMIKLFLMLMMVSVWSGCGKEIEVVKEGDIEYEVYRDETNNKPIKHGYYKEYHPDKSYKVVGNFVEGKQDGKWVWYWENGKIKLEVNYKDGKVGDGKWVEYHESGKVKLERNYKDGKLEGKVVGYYENGQVKQEGNYKYGEKRR